MKTQGWIAKSKDNRLFYWRSLEEMPTRVYVGTGDDIQEEPNTWAPFYGREELPTEVYPELKWEDEPERVITKIEYPDYGEGI